MEKIAGVDIVAAAEAELLEAEQVSELRMLARASRSGARLDASRSSGRLDSVKKLPGG